MKRRGLPVLVCYEGSPAARAGIQRGDLVLAVNGIPTPSCEAFVDARRLRHDGMTVEIERGGETLTLEVELDATRWN